MQRTDSIASLCYGNGILLYTLYRELQESIAHDVILPRLRKWEVSRFIQLVNDSKSALHTQYVDFTEHVLPDDTHREHFEGYVGGLLRDAEDLAAGALLQGRRNELLQRLEELLELLTASPDGIEDGMLVEDKFSQEHLFIVASRLLWPVLFFRPPADSRCWTWPPDERFVLNRLASMAKARRPNTYLPTLLPVSFPTREVHLTPSQGCAFHAAHERAGSGNDQELADPDDVHRLRTGVAAFDDRIIASYYDIDRGKSAIYYDLLLGALSGMQVVVSSGTHDDAPQGLLVLCSPLSRFFHELADLTEAEGTILMSCAPTYLRTDFSEDPLQRCCWTRFGNEVHLFVRSMEVSPQCQCARSLIDDCRTTFRNTNGPMVLQAVASGHEAVLRLAETDRLQALRDAPAIRTRPKITAPVSAAIDLEQYVPGRSDAAKEVRKQIQTAANNPIDIHVFAETGAGKDFVAQAIFAMRNEPHHSFDCSRLRNANSLQAQLELEGLVGHKHSQLSGPTNGLFLAHNGQTVFMNELQDLGTEAQNLLRSILDRGMVTRVGAEQSQPVKFNLITAANRYIPELISQGRFEHDVWRRISTVVIEIPPLRERREDIPAIAQHLVQMNCGGPRIADAAVHRLASLDWPWKDNIGELRVIIDRAAAIGSSSSSGVITQNDIEKSLNSHASHDGRFTPRHPVHKAPNAPSRNEAKESTDTSPQSEWRKKLDRQKKFWQQYNDRPTNVTDQELQRTKFHSAAEAAIANEMDLSLTRADLFSYRDICDYFTAKGVTNAKGCWGDNEAVMFFRFDIKSDGRTGQKGLFFTEADRWISQRKRT